VSVININYFLQKFFYVNLGSLFTLTYIELVMKQMFPRCKVFTSITEDEICCRAVT